VSHQPRNADLVLGRFARRGPVVTRAALLAAGLSHDQVAHRTRTGILAIEFPGVYRIGPASTYARYLAAVLACGSRSGLSGPAAAWWWALVKGKPPTPEVSAPTERRIPGIRTRRRRLHPSELTTHRAIPITSIALTLIDIAPHVPLSDLALACHEAGVKWRATPGQVREALARRPNAPGAAKLRRAMEGEPVLLSELERRFLALLRAHSLPLPTTNKPAGTKRVDCRWPHHKLTVELDSFRFHNSRHSWEQDRRREREAYARGDEFRRYAYADVFEDPRAMLRELRALLRCV
jgi:very-short-patch-repair endonuclease